MFTCIDCSQDFSGVELDNHTSCKTEAEKYFGKFNTEGKGKKGKIGEEEKKGGGKGEAKKDAVEKVKVKENEEETETETGKEKIEKWKGWRNEIKSVLKNAGIDGVEQRKTRKRVIERYVKCFGKKEGLDDIYEKKVNFKRFKLVGDSIFYYRYLNNYQ